MKRLLLVFPLVLVTLVFSGLAWAQPPSDVILSPEELDQLVGPIALYPDPLIAQVLPAATFVDQIEQAADYVDRYGPTGIDTQPWDISVRAVAHYPQVLDLLDERPEWTAALGQAYLNQPQDVMDAIQRLRSAAYAQGNLVSSEEEQVVTEPYGIRIVPALPQYIYVPVYDPELVYVEPPQPGIVFVTFGAPVLIGVWLDRDCDWRHRRVFYHGWRGGGWIGRSRPHIRDRGHIYIGRNASVIRVNRDIRTRDTRGIHREIRDQAVRQRERRGRVPHPTRQPAAGSERHREGIQRGGATGSEVTAPGRTAPSSPTGRAGGARNHNRRPAGGTPPAAVRPEAPATSAPARQSQEQFRRRGPSRGPTATGGAAGGATGAPPSNRRGKRVGNPPGSTAAPSATRRGSTAPSGGPRRHDRGGAPGAAVTASPPATRRSPTPAFNAMPPAARTLPAAPPSVPAATAPHLPAPVHAAPAVPVRPAAPPVPSMPAAPSHPAPFGGPGARGEERR